MTRSSATICQIRTNEAGGGQLLSPRGKRGPRPCSGPPNEARAFWRGAAARTRTRGSRCRPPVAASLVASNRRLRAAHGTPAAPQRRRMIFEISPAQPTLSPGGLNPASQGRVVQAYLPPNSFSPRVPFALVLRALGAKNERRIGAPGRAANPPMAGWFCPPADTHAALRKPKAREARAAGPTKHIPNVMIDARRVDRHRGIGWPPTRTFSRRAFPRASTPRDRKREAGHARRSRWPR